MRQPAPATRVTFAAFLAWALLGAVHGRHPSSVRAASAATPAPSFAHGILLRPAGLGPSPWAAAGAPLPAGTAVSIIGGLSLRVGLRQLTVYEVAAEASAATRGWLASDAVLVQAGTVPALGTAGVAPDAAPAHGAALAGAALSSSPRADPAAAAPPDLPTWLPATVRRWEAPIRAAAAEAGIDPALLAIVVLVESGGWSTAGSQAGASGLTQLMPGTAADLLAARGHDALSDDWREATLNLELGAAYLAAQSRAFAGDAAGDVDRLVRLVAAAYNGGPGRLRQHLGPGGAALPAETQRYQRWVGGMWQERNDPRSPSFEDWRRAGGERLLIAAAAES